MAPCFLGADCPDWPSVGHACWALQHGWGALPASPWCWHDVGEGRHGHQARLAMHPSVHAPAQQPPTQVKREGQPPLTWAVPAGAQPSGGFDAFGLQPSSSNASAQFQRQPSHGMQRATSQHVPQPMRAAPAPPPAPQSQGSTQWSAW